MKKYLYILAALSIVPTFSIAQGLNVAEDVDAELEQMYANAQAQLQADAAQTAVTEQPVYILNNQGAMPVQTQVIQPAQPLVQTQPTTVIQASPLTESRAEQLRRTRQEAELQTEQRIVEKLEQSRMEDERRRANLLFGNAEAQQQQAAQQPVMQQPVMQQPMVQQPVVQQPVMVQQQPAVVVTPMEVQQVAPVMETAVVAEESKENTRDIIREELAAALRTEAELPVEPIQSSYVAGILGVGDYPDARQVEGNYALGVAFGSKYDNFIVEGSFLYSNYSVKGQGYYSGFGYGGYPGYSHGGVFVPDTIDVQQYTGALAAKVQLFSGIVRPVFGGLVSYSYRDFSWGNQAWGYVNDTKAKSHAIDVGAIVGADLEFNPRYSLGLDFRYMWNLSSRVDSGNSWMSTSDYYNPIEKLQYYVMSIVGRVNF